MPIEFNVYIYASLSCLQATWIDESLISHSSNNTKGWLPYLSCNAVNIPKHLDILTRFLTLSYIKRQQEQNQSPHSLSNTTQDRCRITQVATFFVLSFDLSDNPILDLIPFPVHIPRLLPWEVLRLIALHIGFSYFI